MMNNKTKLKLALAGALSVSAVMTPPGGNAYAEQQCGTGWVQHGQACTSRLCGGFAPKWHMQSFTSSCASLGVCRQGMSWCSCQPGIS
jgi:hypothetical protein